MELANICKENLYSLYLVRQVLSSTEMPSPSHAGPGYGLLATLPPTPTYIIDNKLYPTASHKRMDTRPLSAIYTLSPSDCGQCSRAGTPFQPFFNVVMKANHVKKYHKDIQSHLEQGYPGIGNKNIIGIN